ncbi:hypothetical protein L208DRAFT_811488 [Tricholoma matsutake]|nr:hypothetical protein L208DRAFT_811488 [Tricholoma matsutake 945]
MQVCCCKYLLPCLSTYMSTGRYLLRYSLAHPSCMLLYTGNSQTEKLHFSYSSGKNAPFHKRIKSTRAFVKILKIGGVFSFVIENLAILSWMGLDLRPESPYVVGPYLHTKCTFNWAWPNQSILSTK